MWNLLNLFAVILIVSGIVIALSLMAYASEHPREIIKATRRILTYDKKEKKSRTCRYCGSEIGENLTHCPNCGAPVHD